MVGKWHLMRRGRDEPRVVQEPVAARPRLRALLRLPRRGDQPVVSRPRLRQPSGRAADARPRRATTSRPTSPTRRSSSSRTPRRSPPTSRSSSTSARAPATRPHHAPKEWADKYKGKFDMGYEAYRELVFERQKKLGHRPRAGRAVADQPLHRRDEPDGQGWPRARQGPSVGLALRRREAAVRRMAEVYAGFLSHADHQIGRLLDYLEESGQLDNTIIVLVSDNGASGEGGPNGSVNENKFFNGVPDRSRRTCKYLDDLGGPRTYNHYPTGWAWAFNTPFKMWKRYAQLGGRHGRPDDRLVAGADRSQTRRPAPVHPRHRHRARRSTSAWGSSCRRWSRATRSTRSRASASPPPSPTPTPRPASRRSSTRCSARGRSGTRAGRRRR